MMILPSGRNKEPLLSARNQYVYEYTRKGKMYRKNRVLERLDHCKLAEELPDGLKGVIARFYYTRFIEGEQYSDLKANYPEKLMQKAFMPALVKNLAVSIKNDYCDSNNYIFTVKASGNDSEIRDYLLNITGEEAAAFASMVEIIASSKDGDRQIILLGYTEGEKRQPVAYEKWSLLGRKPVTVEIPPVEVIPFLSPEELEEYHQVVVDFHGSFFADVEDRACTIWGVSKTWTGDAIIRRYIPMQSGEVFAFTDDHDDTLELLKAFNIYQVVPNTLPDTAENPVEIVIDVDIPRVFPFPAIKLISDTFDSWLRSKGFHFERRLTGSLKGGQHFILPVFWDDPVILAGKVQRWDDYTSKADYQILCDSAKSAGETLVLLFQLENHELAGKITTRIFDSHSRHERLLFDLSPNGANTGRRGILSMHKSGNLCIPLEEDVDFPSKRKELEKLVAIDSVSLRDSIEVVGWKSTVASDWREYNTPLLVEIVEDNDKIFTEYLVTPPMRFEHHWFNLPVPELPVNPLPSEQSPEQISFLGGERFE